jgi:hypothetical protein
VNKSRSHVVPSAVISAALEIAIVISLLPKDSTQPRTPFQNALAFTQAPAAAAAFLIFGTGLGRQIDKLPEPFGMAIATIGIAIVVALQWAAIAVPIWLGFQGWRAYRAHRGMI